MSPIALFAAVLLCSVALAADLSQYFGTARPYVYNDGLPQAPLSGCSVSGVYYVSRHGSRYPTSGKIKKEVELATFVHNYKVKSSFKWMKDWNPQFTQEYEGMLSKLGAKDLTAIGTRFGKNYKDLLFPYTTNAVVTKCTGVPRTAQTAAAFTVGAMGMDAWMQTPWVAVSESKTNDRVLRFFDACDKYITRVDKNKSVTAEKDTWLAQVAPGIAKKIAKMTGLPEDEMSSQGMVSRMWDTCTFEQTVLGRSDWCSVFDKEDAKLLEFGEDLDKYYTSGYGIPVSYKIAAPLVQDIFKYTDAVVAGTEGTPRAKLMFAHAETMLPLKAILGMHKDAKPLTAAWTEAERDARKWRNSEISTMATNLAFVVSKCSSGEHQIQMLESETPVDFPNVQGCKKNWCPLSAVKASYSEALNAKFESLCSSTGQADDDSFRGAGSRVVASALVLAALLAL
eukprot:m51a1_g6792 hypothetical protein (453) ;mRNA; f:201078-202507